jgi:hypothetical protein
VVAHGEAHSREGNIFLSLLLLDSRGEKVIYFLSLYSTRWRGESSFALYQRQGSGGGGRGGDGEALGGRNMLKGAKGPHKRWELCMVAHGEAHSRAMERFLSLFLLDRRGEKVIYFLSSYNTRWRGESSFFHSIGGREGREGGALQGVGRATQEHRRCTGALHHGTALRGAWDSGTPKRHAA